MRESFIPSCSVFQLFKRPAQDFIWEVSMEIMLS